MQLDRVMSMMRYSAPKGTAGLARSRVSGHRRSPCPPARRTPMASRISGMLSPSFRRVQERHSINRALQKHNSRSRRIRSRLPVPEHHGPSLTMKTYLAGYEVSRLRTQIALERKDSLTYLPGID